MGGAPAPPSGASEIIGLEASGHVADLGAGVTGWEVGDPCVALLAGGGYADLGRGLVEADQQARGVPRDAGER